MSTQGIFNTISATLLLLTLSACSTIRNGGAPATSFDIDADLASLSRQFENAASINEYYKSATADRKDARNKFIAARLVQVDLQYLKFIRSLTADKQQLDAASELASMTLNLAGTLVGGVRAKANLAAGAAGLSGTKSTIDKDFYYEKSIEALVATMNAKRKEVLANILTALSTPIDQYTFERAVTDTYQYYLAGTLNGAIQFINVQASQTETVADKKLQSVYELRVLTPEQLSSTAALKDAMEKPGITQAQIAAVLIGIGVAAKDIPNDLAGAGDMLVEKISAAKQSDAAVRSSALAGITQEFKKAGLMK